MAWRRLAKEATAEYPRRGAGLAASPRLTAPARAFSAAPPAANPAGEFRVFGLFLSPMARRAGAFGVPSAAGRNGAQSVSSRCSGTAFRAGVPSYGGLLAGRMARGFYPQLSGHKLLKGLGTGSAFVATLCSQKIAYADEQPSEDIVRPSAKHQITKLCPLIRKYQLPVGVIALIALGWQNPLGLLINILLILYSSTPNPYSIYLFLQEIRHGETHQHPASWTEEAVLTRKVDAKDYKFFSIGTVETADRKVLHVIGILGSWWIYRSSYGK
ncbi:uncharacterized protein LOC102708838 [Oryza brachyantha]|uniref:Uncharacterized protein n=1 Tax=Oryza brachyantha TaxID=4533 RepID=J3KWS8_ORYBR|nr:uncharacterized protein LOC102708838 [Oryza brachyantha]